MLKKVIDFFTNEGSALHLTATGASADENLRVAAAVLLLEMAGADEDYAPEETDAIFRLLQSHFRMGEEEVVELLELADAVRQHRDRLDNFIQTVNANFDVNQRQRLFAAVWKVVLADGRVDAEESRHALRLKARLELTDEQVEKAKKAAERGDI